MSKVVREDLRLVNNLRDAAKQYADLKRDRAKTAVELYHTFLRNYIFNYENNKKKIAQDLKEFFGKDKIKIVAIDGTKYQRSRRGCLVFYVLAAPLVYELDLNSKLKPVRIEEESKRSHVMALVPIPLSEIFLIGEEPVPEVEEEVEEAEVEEEIGDFYTPQKIGKIDVVLMKLAEVYTAYWCMENIKPDVLMIDGSLFQDYSFSNRSPEKLNLFKGNVLGHKTTKDDFYILKSVPVNSELELPSSSFTREFLTAELMVFGKIEMSKYDLSFKSRLKGKEVKITKRQLDNLKKVGYLRIDEKDDKVTITLKDHYRDAWDRLKKLFLDVCEEGFVKNNLAAFKIIMEEDGRKSYRYMCEEDIETLSRIGYNMMIEESWKNNTLIFSVTKDSYVRFFVDNFLTIAGPRHLKVFDLNQDLLPRVPSTDAGMIYDISVGVDGLHPPFSVMEYDPAISTVYSSPVGGDGYEINQLRKVAQEREFLRSLVQIAEDSSGRKSYVYTVDRITYPKFDSQVKTLTVKIGNKEYKFAYYLKPNRVIETIVGLMTILSSNRHDAVFGYPDPLFEVDQYVKTLGRAHLETLDLALTEIDLDEFSVTYRQMRERGEM